MDPIRAPNNYTISMGGSMLTQRSHFAIVSTLAFGVFFGTNLLSWGQAPMVRYEARSPDGKKMLKTYAKAVALMKGKAETDPLAWQYQWYTHWVSGETTKAKELKRIFPMAGAGRDLAQAMWSTCQPHGQGMDPDNFLPWH